MQGGSERPPLAPLQTPNSQGQGGADFSGNDIDGVRIVARAELHFIPAVSHTGSFHLGIEWDHGLHLLHRGGAPDLDPQLAPVVAYTPIGGQRGFQSEGMDVPAPAGNCRKELCTGGLHHTDARARTLEVGCGKGEGRRGQEGQLSSTARE